MINSPSVLDEEYDDTDDGFHYQTRQSSLSRLSICTSSFHEDDEDNSTNHPSELSNFISELSLESLDDVGAEADGEISDDCDDSDSDKESSGFYSLPTITSHRRRKVKSEESELKTDGSKCNIVRERRVLREKSKRENQFGLGFIGVERDSDGDGNRYGGGGELTVLTKVKGGKKSMRMGYEEVKAFRDLGFDLEVPGRVSVSAGSNRDTQTSSGGNSPIANWRISSPGNHIIFTFMYLIFILSHSKF